MVTVVYHEMLEQLEYRKQLNPETRSNTHNADSEFRFVVARGKKTAFVYVDEVYFGKYKYANLDEYDSFFHEYVAKH
jgi:hypothetical protein